MRRVCEGYVCQNIEKKVQILFSFVHTGVFYCTLMNKWLKLGACSGYAQTILKYFVELWDLLTCRSQYHLIKSEKVAVTKFLRLLSVYTFFELLKFFF